MIDTLKPIFEKIDADFFNEDTLKTISTVIEETVTNRVQEKLDLAVESALKTQDEEVTRKTEHLIETFRTNIDQDHTAKIKFVVESLNNDHMEKLLNLKSKYDTLLEKTAIEHKNDLVNEVDKFLEKYIDKNLPAATIQEAAKNRHVEGLLEKIKQVAGVDPKFIKENVKEAILDGKKKHDQVLAENDRLRKERDAAMARQMVIEKTKNLPKDVANFVRSRLANKSPQYIHENFEFVVELFEKNEQQTRKSIQKSRPPVVVESAPVYNRLVNERSNQPQGTDPMMNMYMQSLQTISRAKS